MLKNGCGTLKIPYISVITKRNCWSGSKFQYSKTSFNDFPRSICNSNCESYYASDAPFQTRRRPRRGPRRVGLARRPRRVGRGVGHYAVESVPTYSVTATHINCYIYIIIVYEYVRDMYGLYCRSMPNQPIGIRRYFGQEVFWFYRRCFGQEVFWT